MIPPYDSEYTGYLRLPPLIQMGTQSSTLQTSQIGYLLTEVMTSLLQLCNKDMKLLMLTMDPDRGCLGSCSCTGGFISHTTSRAVFFSQRVIGVVISKRSRT